MADEWSHKVEAMDMPHELEELMILSIESVVHNGDTNALIRGMMVRVSDADSPREHVENVNGLRSHADASSARGGAR